MSYAEDKRHDELISAIKKLTSEVAAFRDTIESSPVLFPPVIKTAVELGGIPEAVTARWINGSYDPINLNVRVECGNCHNRTIAREGALPTVCPHCKAVMTGVE